jgi:hypothetical protein
MSSTISTIVGAIGSWLGGWSATLFAIVIAPPLEQVRNRLFPPAPPPPLVTTDDLADLRLSIDLLGGQMDLLRESIAGIERTLANGIDLQVVLRSRRPNANSSQGPPGAGH